MSEINQFVGKIFKGISSSINSANELDYIQFDEAHTNPDSGFSIEATSGAAGILEVQGDLSALTLSTIVDAGVTVFEFEGYNIWVFAIRSTIDRVSIIFTAPTFLGLEAVQVRAC